MVLLLVSNIVFCSFWSLLREATVLAKLTIVQSYNVIVDKKYGTMRMRVGRVYHIHCLTVVHSLVPIPPCLFSHIESMGTRLRVLQSLGAHNSDVSDYQPLRFCNSQLMLYFHHSVLYSIIMGTE